MLHHLYMISKDDRHSNVCIYRFLLVLSLSIPLNACDENTSSSNALSDANVDQSMIDMEVMTELDNSIEIEADAETVDSGCVWHDDCEEDEQCLDGLCEATTKACQFSQNCDLGEVCYSGRCVEPCLSDLNCPEEGHCINGSCLPFPESLLPTGQIEMLGSADQLWIGVGSADLTYPIGVSPAGYGARPGPSTPYNKSLGGSDSVIERQDVKVIVIDNGEHLSIMTRLPLSWSTDYLRTLIAQEVGRLTIDTNNSQGIDILDHLIIFATHSHSQPGRFWNLVPNLPFGTLGFGKFSKSITDGYAKSAAKAIVEALNNRERGKIGWSLIDQSDPQRRIHSDRRGTVESDFDDRMLALRIDDLTGQPRAAVVGFGIHGTIMMKPLLTGDAIAGIEQVLSEELSAKYGRKVPVLFANGNAGNTSPRGDFLTNQKLGHLQTIGSLLWQVYEPIFDSTETYSDLSLNLAIQRIELGYEQIGYNLVDQRFEGRDGPYQYGAFQCVITEKSNEEESYTLDETNCLLDLQRVVHEPVVQFQKTIVTVMQLGELFITTLPGEPGSSLGLNLAQAIEQDAQAAGYEQARSFNIGYAQDHQFYLLSPDDWYRGGYEASLSTWGPYMGRYVSESVYNLAQSVISGEDLERTRLKPTWWPQLEDDSRLAPADASNQAEWITQPNSELYRGQLLTFEWKGGDPAVDLPQISIRNTEDDSPVVHPLSGLIFDDTGFESVIKYLGDYSSDQRWSSQWDLPNQLPVGSYYMRIEGKIGIDAEAYVLQSEPFSIRGEQGLLIHASEFGDGLLNLKLSYHHAPSNDDGVSPFDSLQAQGTLLHLRTSKVDLSQTTTQYKDLSFIVGSPVNQELTLQMWHNNSPIDNPREADLNINISPRSITCDINMVTSRSETGEEMLRTLNDWPCSEYQVDLNDYLLDNNYYLLVRDYAGNQSNLINLNNLTTP